MAKRKPKKKSKSKSSRRTPQSSSQRPAADPVLANSFEDALAGLGPGFGLQAGDFELSDLERAEIIVDEAWEAETDEEAIQGAWQALAVYGDCVAAHVLLAEVAAETAEEALTHFRRGVEAGRRALGAEAFAEYAGHFWGVFETRPFMRAMNGMAGALNEMERFEECVEVCQEMLRLNPHDNLGIRYLFLPLLIELQEDEKAESLWHQFEDDGEATWLYCRALLDFRREGSDSDTARESLRAAVARSPFLATFFKGDVELFKTRVRKVLPEQRRDAIRTMLEITGALEKTPGAFAWVSEFCARS